VDSLLDDARTPPSRERAADGRVAPAMGSSSAGVGYNAHPDIGGAVRSRLASTKLVSKSHLFRNRLNGLGRQPAAVEDHRELVAPEM